MKRIGLALFAVLAVVALTMPAGVRAQEPEEPIVCEPIVEPNGAVGFNCTGEQVDFFGEAAPTGDLDLGGSVDGGGGDEVLNFSSALRPSSPDELFDASLTAAPSGLM